MDGSRTVARLVAEFARIAGRLAPDQVPGWSPTWPATGCSRSCRSTRSARCTRCTAGRCRPGSAAACSPPPAAAGWWWPTSTGWSTALYRAGGRLLFTRAAAVVLAVVARGRPRRCSAGTWWRGDAVGVPDRRLVRCSARSVLLGLNVLALACHELGHALATKHAGRRGAGRRLPGLLRHPVGLRGHHRRVDGRPPGPDADHRRRAGHRAGAGRHRRSSSGWPCPAAAPWAFKLAFAWYLNALFNLNPFLALDGYYLLMDWLEIPNLRARGLAWVGGRLRRRPPRWAELDREGRLVALYGMLAVLWLVIAVNLG